MVDLHETQDAEDLRREPWRLLVLGAVLVLIAAAVLIKVL